MEAKDNKKYKNKRDVETNDKMKIEIYEGMVEVYKKSVSDLRWALAILVPVFVMFIGYLIFKDNQDYKKAVEEARIAMLETREVASRIYEIERKAEELFKNSENEMSRKINDAFIDIDDRVAVKLQETTDKGEELLSQISERGVSHLEEIKSKGEELLSEISERGIEITAKEEKLLSEISERGVEIAAKGERLFQSTDLWHKGLRALDEKEYKEASDHWVKAVDIDPNNRGALHNLGIAFAGIAEQSEGEYADKYFDIAYYTFEKAFSIDPNRGTHTLRVWGDKLVAQAMKKNGEEADMLFAKAYEKYEKALSIDNSYADALVNWGTYLVEQAKAKQGGEVDKIFEQAFNKFTMAIRLEPDDEQPLFYFGNALYEYAKKKEGQEKTDNLRKAQQKFEDALTINPNDYNALNFLGLVYQNLSETTKDQDIEILSLKAKNAYLHAFSINPQNDQALLNLGNLFFDLAKRSKSFKERDRLIEQACEKYEWAFHRSKDAMSLENWGFAYLLRGLQVRNIGELKRFVNKACEKYEMASKLNPRDEVLLDYWARSILILSREEKGTNRQKLVEEAKQICLLSESIRKGSGAFALACINSMGKNEEECKHWLKVAEETGNLPTLKGALEFGTMRSGFFNFKVRSGFLAYVKNKKWFKEIKWK